MTVPTAIRLASRVRGERVIHAKGRAFTGVLQVHGLDLGVPLLDRARSHDVLIRFSRSVGLPDRLPDALGLAIRVLDAHGEGKHQDLLLTTGDSRPIVRHSIVPRRDLLGSTYTTLVPYRFAGASWLVAALPAEGHPRAAALQSVRPEQVVFDLAIGHSVGPWEIWGRVSATAVAEDGRAVRFAPEVTGGGIEPPLLAMRGGAYRASHVGADS